MNEAGPLLCEVLLVELRDVRDRTRHHASARRGGAAGGSEAGLCCGVALLPLLPLWRRPAAPEVPASPPYSRAPPCYRPAPALLPPCRPAPQARGP